MTGQVETGGDRGRQVETGGELGSSANSSRYLPGSKSVPVTNT